MTCFWILYVGIQYKQKHGLGRQYKNVELASGRIQSQIINRQSLVITPAQISVILNYGLYFLIACHGRRLIEESMATTNLLPR